MADGKRTRQQAIDLQRQKVNKMMNVAFTPAEVNRLTVNFSAVLERSGVQPVQVVSRYDSPVENPMQPYIRDDILLTDEWIEFDMGWIRKEVLGQIFIQNSTGIRLLQVPSEKETKAMANQNIFYSTNKEDKFIVRPKRCSFFEPYEVKNLWLCAESTPVKAFIGILPR